MKDLPSRAQPPHPLLSLPRELRLVHVGDGELREAPGSDRRHIVRARSARRRLFVDEESSGEGEGGGAGSGSGNGNGEAGRRRRRPRWQGLRPEDPVAVYVMSPVRDTVDKLSADDTAAASHRWNFDFENERPLDGPWQWEKAFYGLMWQVGGAAEGVAEGIGDQEEPAAPRGEGHSPQR